MESNTTMQSDINWVKPDSGKEVAILGLSPSRMTLQRDPRQTLNELRNINKERFLMLFPHLRKKDQIND